MEVLGLPAVLELLEDAAAAFAETRIAQFSVIYQYLSACGGYGFGNLGRRLTRNTLIALAVVIRADIKVDMVFAIVPLDAFAFRLGTCIVFGTTFGYGLILLNLSQQPRTRNHCVSLEQFQRCISTHLGRYDT